MTQSCFFDIDGSFRAILVMGMIEERWLLEF
jgi:hypothetical protein